MKLNPLLQAAAAALRTLRAPLTGFRASPSKRALQYDGGYAVLPLEPRQMINSPISPSGLIMSIFASGNNANFGGIYMDLAEAAFSSSTVSGFNFHDTSVTDAATDPFTSSSYDTFHVRYSGVINIAQDGIYYFRLPAADGAVITFDDNNKAIDLPSLIGDTHCGEEPDAIRRVSPEEPAWFLAEPE